MPASAIETAEALTVFSREYNAPGGTWGGHSGAGSSTYSTLPYRVFLESFIVQNKIKHVTDIGCGDWQFSRLIDFSLTQYHGYDIVSEIIDRNQKDFGGPTVKFSVMPPKFDSIPRGELLVMKDVLQHLSNETIEFFIENVFPKFKCCLLTNSYRKLDTPQNSDIMAGGFRCLDLSTKPFNLDGSYLLEFGSTLWEQIRTFLYKPRHEHSSITENIIKIDTAQKELIFLQTSDAEFYKPMLDFTAEVNIEYCRQQGFGYESYVGIKNGIVPWMASYNRIYMLYELVQRGHRGWVIFADADAFVCNFLYDITQYLKANESYCLIGATGGSDAPWNLNSGILFINLGDPVGRAFIVDWLDRFQSDVPTSYLASSNAEWDEYPNDQGIMYDCIQNVPGLMAKTKREEGLIFNYHDGLFMKQAIRAGHPDMASRLNWIKSSTQVVMQQAKIIASEGVQRNLVVMDGDSITKSFPDKTLLAWPNAYPLDNLHVDMINVGFWGDTLFGRQHGFASNVAPLYRKDGPINIVHIAAGSNDIAMLEGSSGEASTVYASMRNYAERARKCGFKVIVTTILPRSDLTVEREANRVSFNESLRKNWPDFADGLSDWATDTALGTASFCCNETLSLDGVHPTDAGYNSLANISLLAISSLLLRRTDTKTSN